MLLLSLLIVLLSAQSSDAFAYSCLEIQSEFVGWGFAKEFSYMCVIPQVGFTNWEQLRNIKQTTLFDIADSVTHCLDKSPSAEWQFQSEPFDLDCDQEFALIVAKLEPDFIIPSHEPSEHSVARDTIVVPETGMWMRKKSCLSQGTGNVTMFTGAGVDDNDHKFEMISWPCSSVPDLMVSFDNVITIETDANVEFEMEVSSNLDRNARNVIPFMVNPGDNIAVLTSGRSDDRQNLQGVNNIVAFETTDGNTYDVTANLDITFDRSDPGAVFVEEYYGGPMKEYFGGKYTDYLGFTNYFEIHYVPKGLEPSEIDANQDNIVIEITIAGLPPTRPSTKPAPTTTQARTSTRVTTIEPVKTTTQAIPSTKATTLPPAKTTTNIEAPTTMTAPPKPASDGPYCNCKVDKFGFPVGWNYNDIWLDVIFILDTSEAMGDAALADASTLIESFISDGVNDYLITDPSAPFYTRVGVIGMADTATVLFDLNMTKADNLQGKVMIKKGVDEINVVDAFDVALRMFSDGYTEERANTRQVIYYMTDSNPGANLNPLNQFKTSQGVIIVDNFLEEGEVEIPRLKELASNGYYFSNSNYMEGLQAFCKANCFCKPSRDTYGGSDPAIAASGGCYHPSPAGVPFNKAKSTCTNEGGIIATVHDDNKGYFLQQLMTRSSSKSSYFWIGYEKSDSGAWQWEDQSIDAFTNWDVDEPSTAAVSKCAYIDTTSATLPWGAGNCQIGFPYICQYTPCSVGNKDC